MKRSQLKKLVKKVLNEVLTIENEFDGKKTPKHNATCTADELAKAKQVANEIWTGVYRVDFHSISGTQKAGNKHFVVSLHSPTGPKKYLYVDKDGSWFFSVRSGEQSGWEKFDGQVNEIADFQQQKPTYIKSLGLQFDDDEVKLMVSGVEQFGTGAHPSADKGSIGYFDKDYVVQCLQKLRPEMEKNSRLKTFVPKVDELIKKLNSGYGVTSEESSTGGVAGYSTPNAFTKNKKGSVKGIEAAKKYGKVVGEAPRV